LQRDRATLAASTIRLKIHSPVPIDEQLDRWIRFSEDAARGIAKGAIIQAAKPQVQPTRSEIAFQLCRDLWLNYG
jgi:hypothetical protein